MDPRTLEYLAAVVFTAGGAWVTVRTMRRDLNGIGRKLRRMQLLLIKYAPPEKRDELIEDLLDGE